jgi:hypothetical protein
MNSNSWIVEEELPAPAGLRVVQMNDPDYGMSEDEIQDRNEFIRSYIRREYELLMMIPAPDNDDIFIGDYTSQDAEYSAFNTHDYQRTLRPFNKYSYAMQKIMERVKDIAILHSSISCPEGRQEEYEKYKRLVDFEFRNRLKALVSRHRYADMEDRFELKRRIAELSRRILECRKIWEHYAPRDS